MPRKGGLVLGVCNGFQILCEAGLLPGVLMRNARLRFICRDVYLRVERSDTPFTRGYNAGQVIRVPVAHGEGNYIADARHHRPAGRRGAGAVPLLPRPTATLDPAWNLNGAINAIAGIVNERGNVLGMMPHPENHVEAALGGTDGRGLFAGLVRGAWSGRHSVIPNEPNITPELVAEHGLKPDEYQRILDLIGREPTLHRARHLLGDVERALLVQVLQGPSAHAADQGAVGDPGAGRERRRHRHRRRARRRVQDGEPQPPELHRALSGRGDRRRRHPARRVHHGRAADRLPQCAVASAIRSIPRRGISCPAWSPASAATAIPSACRRSAAQVRFHRRYDGNNLVNAMAVGLAETDKIFYAAASGVGMPIVYLGSKTGRDGIHGATHGLGRVRRGRRGEAPDRAGRRSVLGEAAARSLPRDHGEGLRHRHPGHGRGGPDLLGGRDGRQGRSRRRRSISTRCRAARPA